MLNEDHLENPLFSLKVAKYILPFQPTESWDPTGLEVLFRSRLGYLLKARYCPFPDFEDKKRDCSFCRLVTACFFPYFFHPDKLPAEMKTDKQPFLVSVVRDEFSDHPHSLGEHLQLTLFGKAIPYHRPLMESLQHVLEHMIGEDHREDLLMQTGKWHTVYPILQEENLWQTLEVYSPPGDGSLGAPMTDWIASMSHQEVAVKDMSKAEILLATPIQLDAKKTVPEAVSFRVLLDAIIRRLRDLKRYYGEDTHMGPLSSDFYKHQKQVRHRLVDVFVYDETLKTYDKAIRLHGVQGLLTLQGPLEPFMPFLRAGEIIGVGRRISYGLGRIKVL